MSNAAALPFTWTNFAKAALVVAAEVALLNLIADAPLIVKAATLVTALLGLATLEFREWLQARRHHLFAGAVTILSVGYLCFAGYAIYHAYREQQITDHLQEL